MIYNQNIYKFPLQSLMFLLLSLLLAFCVEAKNYGSITVKQVTSIYNADTFRVVIGGYPAIAGERIPVRVLGVDAPKLRGKCESEKLKVR